MAKEVENNGMDTSLGDFINEIKGIINTARRAQC